MSLPSQEPSNGWPLFTMNLIMTNQFHKAEELLKSDLCRLDSSRESAGRAGRMAVMKTMLQLLKAIATFGENDLALALQYAWEAEKLGAEIEKRGKKSSELLLQMEGKLVQADAYLIGALAQILQQIYVKAVWNIRKSWGLYKSARADAASGKLNMDSVKGHAEDLVGWADFGNGFFNLMLSLLPPHVMRIAGWVGFKGEKAEGLTRLRSSTESNSFLAPMSRLVLLTYFVSIAVFTGDQTPEMVEEAKRIIDQGLEQYPGSVFLMFMDSRWHRMRSQNRVAIEIAETALQASGEIPAAGVLFHYQKGWCAYQLLEWKEAASYLDQLLIEGGPKSTPPTRASVQGFYCYHIGICYLMLEDWESARSYFGRVKEYIEAALKLAADRKRPPRAMEMYAQRKSAMWVEEISSKLGKVDKSKPKSAEVILQAFRRRACLDTVEILYAWNSFDQMDTKSLDQCAAMLDDRCGSAKSKVELAKYNVLRAKLSLAQGGHKEALKMLQNNVDMESEITAEAAKEEPAMPFTYFDLALLHTRSPSPDLDQAAAALKKAAAFKEYDLSRMMQFRLHTLRAEIARGGTKVGDDEPSSKGNSTKDLLEGQEDGDDDDQVEQAFSNSDDSSKLTKK